MVPKYLACNHANMCYVCNAVSLQLIDQQFMVPNFIGFKIEATSIIIRKEQMKRENQKKQTTTSFFLR